MDRQREDADDELAGLAPDIEIERICRGVEPSEDRRGTDGAGVRIDRASDARELVVAQRAAAIIEHRQTIDSGRCATPS
jgi:hypothetical protein